MTHDGERLVGMVSNAVRVGGTVLRDTGPWTPTIHALLRHLRQRGFPVPEVQGVDEGGREHLTWIEGRPGIRPWPEELRTEQGMRALGRFLRRCHEAVRDFDPGSQARWRIGRRPLREGQIVRHGDLGPYNILFAGGEPIALVDWDMAEPGSPEQDLAQLAWLSVPLRGRAIWTAAGFSSTPRFSERLAALCEGYGWGDPRELVSAVGDLQRLERERLRTWGRQGIHPWSMFVEAGDLEELESEMRWLAEQEPALGGRGG